MRYFKHLQKSETDTCLTDYYNIEYLNIQFGLKANSLNTYTKDNEVDIIINILGSPSMLSIINNNGTNIVYMYIYQILDIQKQKLILLYQLRIINRNW